MFCIGKKFVGIRDHTDCRYKADLYNVYQTFSTKFNEWRKKAEELETDRDRIITKWSEE